MKMITATLLVNQLLITKSSCPSTTVCQRKSHYSVQAARKVSLTLHLQRYIAFPLTKLILKDFFLHKSTIFQDRVKQAIRQEQEDPGQRKRRKAAEKSEKSRDDIESKGDKHNDYTEKSSDKDDKPKVKKKPPPPPMDFAQLLKIAEKKQHEPIVIETKVKPKPEEVERPMTARQKKEFEKEREWREKKALREKNPQLYKSLMEKKDVKPQASSNNNNATNIKNNVKIPKVTNGKAPEKDPVKLKTSDVKERPKVPEKSKSEGPSKNLNRESTDAERMKLLEERRKIERERQELEEMRRKFLEEKEKLL